MPIICPDVFEEWKEDYKEWQECKEDEGEAKEDYWKAVAAVEIACPGGLAIATTGLGIVVAGAACGAALWNWYDAWDDLGDQIEECKEKSAESNKQGEKYNKCVADHKKD